jgi:hypothetical protein
MEGVLLLQEFGAFESNPVLSCQAGWSNHAGKSVFLVDRAVASMAFASEDIFCSIVKE